MMPKPIKAVRPDLDKEVINAGLVGLKKVKRGSQMNHFSLETVNSKAADFW